MKKGLLLILAAVVVLGGCAKKGVQLEEGTPAYELAKSLSDVVPFADPDKNEVLIKSDDWVITSGEVIQHVYDTAGNRTSQLKQMNPEKVIRTIENAAVGLAERKLLLSEATQKGISINDQEVDSILALNYNRFGGEEQFKKMVTQQGQDFAFIKADIRERHMIDKYMKSIFDAEIQITDEDVQAAYSQPVTASVRHILFMTRGKSDSEVVEIKKKAEEVLAKAKAGDDFVKLVEQYSDDPGSKAKGGLYEDFKRGVMVKPFEEAAFNLPLGSISDLVETTYGYHILKIVDHKTETKPLTEVQDTIKANLEREKQIEIYEKQMLILKEAVHYDIVGF